MASLSGPVLNFCRRCGNLLRPLARILMTRTQIQRPVRCLLVPSFLLAQCKQAIPLDLQPPPAEKLTQQALIRSASAQTSDAVTALLSQTAHSLIEAEQKYRETVKVLMQLLELHLTVLGNKDEEDRVWDVVLQGRCRAEQYEKHIRDLTCLFSTVQKLVESTAEVAFMAGSEFTSTSLGERLHNAQRHVECARKESTNTYSQLQELQARCIKKITEHAKKQEHIRRIEEEQMKKLQEELFVKQDDCEGVIFDDYFYGSGGAGGGGGGGGGCNCDGNDNCNCGHAKSNSQNT